MQAKRKYFSETALIIPSARCAFLPPEELRSGKDVPADALEIIDASHIYLICRRERLSFDPDTFRYGKQLCSGHLIRTLSGNKERHPFSMPIVNEDGGIVSVGPYPHRRLVGRDRMGIATREWPASFVANSCQTLKNISDFEVLYVGQAIGDGSRTAFERLQSHDTLQKVLAETLAHRPDDEVMLFLFEYPEISVGVHMDGREKEPEISGEQDIGHTVDVMQNPPSKKERISMVEAGLIWYFKPKYNEKLKESQPNKKLKLLEHCYRFDISGIVVEINTEELYCRLFSQVREPGYHHVAQYDLHDPKVRRSYFSLLDDEGEIVLMDSSGPAY